VEGVGSSADVRADNLRSARAEGTTQMSFRQNVPKTTNKISKI